MRADAPSGELPWLALLGSSERGGRDCAPRVEGELPQGLQGSLYRNGPGLFERGGARKRHLLDGDGLIQRLSFRGGAVRYQNAFVRTPKFERESAAGRALHATWTTRRPGGPLRNLRGGPRLSQAGVTVSSVFGRLLARDEIGPSYQIDPETLQTVAELPAGDVQRFPRALFKAHAKFDPTAQQWLLVGQEYGRAMRVHVASYEADLRLRSHWSFAVPRQVYLHDFFATRSQLLLVLHPCYFRVWPYLAGLRSFTDSLHWRGGDGNLLALVPRGGGEPSWLEAPGSFIWHTLNAFERGDQLIADFVGYDEPDHFLGPDALFAALMAGRSGRYEAAGMLRRYIAQPSSGKLREEIIDPGNHEFPMLDARIALGEHAVGYFAWGPVGGVHTGLRRFDYRRETVDTFDFGPGVQVGEPVFAARPGGGLDEGWLLAQCLDGAACAAFFAVLDAQALGAGPLALIWLDHLLPLSFHGVWCGST
jgi:all-trans-8'-apo-beta-carotenal 15,15'-oxygenase